MWVTGGPGSPTKRTTGSTRSTLARWRTNRLASAITFDGRASGISFDPLSPGHTSWLYLTILIIVCRRLPEFCSEVEVLFCLTVELLEFYLTFKILAGLQGYCVKWRFVRLGHCYMYLVNCNLFMYINYRIYMYIF